MNKFKIIEDGRLTASEMKGIYGGYTCGFNIPGVYNVQDNCGKDLVGKYSACIFIYRSCTDKEFVQCIDTYTGPTGPDGFIDKFNPNPHL